MISTLGIILYMIFADSRDSSSSIIFQFWAFPRPCISLIIHASLHTSAFSSPAWLRFYTIICSRSHFMSNRCHLNTLSSIFSSLHTSVVRFRLFWRRLSVPGNIGAMFLGLFGTCLLWLNSSVSAFLTWFLLLSLFLSFP